MSLFLQSIVLVTIAMVTWPVLKALPLTTKSTAPIGWISFGIAAFILQDFAKRGSPMPEKLGDAYGASLVHTASHAVWTLVLNVFFMLGFTSLMTAYKSVPNVMAVWLIAALLVPSMMDWKQFLSMGQNKAFALAGLLTGIYFLWRDSAR